MRVGVGAEGEVVSTHLPPVEQSLLLKVAANRRVKVIERLQTPLDGNMVPDPIKYLNHLSMTLDSSYVPPRETNVHHLVYPKADYAAFGPSSIQSRYRETPSLMLDIPVQIHNYGHWVMDPPKMQSFDRMRQVVEEQDQVNRLFKIARSVIIAQRWLDGMRHDGMQLYQTAEDYVMRLEPNEDIFYDALDQAEDGIFGIMPNRQQLADMGLHAATRHLGAKAAARSLVLHREARNKVRTLEIDDEPFLGSIY